jgi:ABC-type lipoprotein release transport system permease subunit
MQLFATVAASTEGCDEISGILFGVQPDDPAVYSAAALFVLTMTLAVSFRPALRAAKIDPAITIRVE